MEEILMKFGVKTGHLITGFIAGLMGMLFNKRPQTFRQRVRAYIVVFFGALLTGYITPAILLKWKWLIDVEYSVAFVVGLFGMGLIESIFVIINKLKNDPLSVIERLKKIWKG